MVGMIGLERTDEAEVIGALGRVPRSDLERTLNLGIGFVAVLPAAHAAAAEQAVKETALA